MMAPRFRPYPQTKDAGIEWRGQIPAHWQSKKLKHVVGPGRPITYGIVQCGPDVAPDGVPYIRPVDMHDERGANPECLQHTTREIAAPYSRAEVQGGDLVVSIGPSFGKVMVVPDSLEGANLTQGTARVAISSSQLPRFFFWLLRSAHTSSSWETAVGGATFRALTLTTLSQTPIAVPPFDEQQAIADFLDHETAKIDALVEKKERLIGLLQEKRTALITHAVTKGLDPDAPMKDSGTCLRAGTHRQVDWLGRIPAHWDVNRVKHLAHLRRGASPRPIDDPIYFDDVGEYAWVRIGDLTASERYLEQTTQRLSELGQSKSVCLEPGELFVSIAATVGKPIITRVKCCIHDGFVSFGNLTTDVEFLWYVLQCGEAHKGLGKLGTQLNLNTETVGGISVPVPDRPEQEGIVRFLDRETAKIDALVAKVREAIERLKEYRTALISAAVTGKIDVREAI